MNRIKNTQRKFGEAGTYVQAVMRVGGVYKPLLLTDDAATIGLDRARSQPEDTLPLIWWQRLANTARKWIRR